MYFALNGLKGHIKWHNDMLVILKKLGWEKLRKKKLWPPSNAVLYYKLDKLHFFMRQIKGI